MYIYMVVLIMGKVMGSWGPLPYDIVSCNDRVSQINAELLVAERDPTRMFEVKRIYPNYKSGDMKFQCLVTDTPPVVENLK